MFELLYAISVALKAFRLPGLCVLSTAIELHMARWLSLRMVDDTGRDETSATALKDAQSVPGAYIDEILLLCVTPHLHSFSVRKSPPPGPRISIMPCIETYASSIQDDHEASLVRGSLEDPQNVDMAGYVSDESVRFATFNFMIRIYSPSYINLPGQRYHL